MYQADFSSIQSDGFAGKLHTVSEVNASTTNRHLQIANLHLYDGQVLLVCRWDHRAISEKKRITWNKGEDLGSSAEGDCSNEQVLFISRDAGKSWMIANGGKSILTLAQGTSFDQPTAVTHAMIDENRKGELYLYYTVNQPMTCGCEYTWRSTSGGEIRRIRLRYDGQDWHTDGKSECVLPMFSSLPDGKGNQTLSVRAICLNPILRLADGTALMPISGRDTLPNPQGMYWRENRCWVLRSEDDAKSWAPFFIGGGNELCLCECTLTELSDGSVYALMRAGYGTGKSLYASRSTDGGRTFSPPAPTGLPNTSSGVKPFLLRLNSGAYLLLQTDEHDTPHRLNMTAFLTDEDGLIRNRWKYKRVLCCDCREKWKGSAYPTAVQDADGTIHIAFAGFTQDTNRMYHLGVTEAWLRGAVYEPAGGMLLGDDAVPRASKDGMTFVNTRSRAQAGCFGAIRGKRRVTLRAQVDMYPSERTFDLLALYSANGSQKELAVTLSVEGISLYDQRGKQLICEPQRTIELTAEYFENDRYIVTLNGERIEGWGASFGDPDTLLTGGSYDDGEAILVTVTALAYGECNV